MPECDYCSVYQQLQLIEACKSIVAMANSTLLPRLTILPFTCLFTGKGKLEDTSTRAAIVQNKGRRLEQRPWSASRPDYPEERGKEECIVRWWTLERAWHTQGFSWMLSCKLLSGVAVGLKHCIWWKSPMVSHARTLFCGEQTNVTAWYLRFYQLFIIKEVQSFKILLNSIEYTITKYWVFYLFCLKILLEHSNSAVPLNVHQQSCGVLSGWEGRVRTPMPLFPFVSLVWPLDVFSNLSSQYQSGLARPSPRQDADQVQFSMAFGLCVSINLSYHTIFIIVTQLWQNKFYVSSY